MAIVLTMADVTATQIIPGVYRSAAWVNTIVPADNLSAKLQPSTKYYVKWKFKKNALIYYYIMDLLLPKHLYLEAFLKQIMKLFP